MTRGSACTRPDFQPTRHAMALVVRTRGHSTTGEKDYEEVGFDFDDAGRHD